MVVDISVEVHCLQPSWVQLENSKYRIYIDDELMTERDWSWDQSIFIQEQIIAEISPNLTHTIRVEVIKSKREHLTQLGLKNLIVSGMPQNSWDGHRDNLSFIIA